MSCNYLVADGCNRPAPGGEVLSPYVRIKFQVKTNQETGTTRDLSEITVGNESAPGIQNSACIKSFEFGQGNGAILKVTIHDDMGGSFTKFMENILKDIKCAIPSSGVTLVVDFGWIRSNCNGSFIVDKSPDYYVVCMSINCNFSDGKFMFEVSGTDTVRYSEDTRYIASFGQDGDGEYITDVLNKTFKDPKTKPTINTDVKFLRIGKGKVCNSMALGACNPLNVEECKFKDKDGQAPKVKVSANNLDKINFAKELIAKYPTDKNKGWIPAYNSMCPDGQVIFWEDPMPDCDEAFSWERTMLGKFIVNGGNDTRVIQFNPSIKWQFASLTLAGGGSGDAQVMANQNGGKNEGKGKDCPSLSRENSGNAGSQTTSEADENQVAKHGPEANKKVDEANAADRRANGFLLNHEPIEADLVIVGDPQLIRPDLCPWRNIWIVFFNPFFIRNTGVVGRNADWLSVPPPGCNPILSNKNWRIQQVTHHIESGKFTTNLRVYLQGGSGLDPNTPLGGIGAGDWIPPTNC